MQSLKHSFKKVVVSHAQLAHAAPDILTTNRRQGIIKIERKGTSSLHVVLTIYTFPFCYYRI